MYITIEITPSAEVFCVEVTPHASDQDQILTTKDLPIFPSSECLYTTPRVGKNNCLQNCLAVINLLMKSAL